MKDLISLFRRTTTGKNFIPEIDGLRFIAIMTVVIFHFHFLLSKEIGAEVKMDVLTEGMNTAGWWLQRMDLGVKVFFGISGFILSLPFFNYYWFGGKKVNVREYLVRRLTRLEPPFVVAVTGFLLVHVLVLGESFRAMFPHYLATLVYLHTPVYNAYSVINPVTWSLETEVQFYLIIPVLSYWILSGGNKKKALMIGILLFLGSIAMRGWILREGPYGMMANISGYFSHFAVGIGFAYLYLTREKWLRNANAFWDLIGVLSIISLFVWYKPQAGFINQVLFNGSIFLLFLSVFKGKILNRIFTLPVVYLIGGMCYSIYLLHLAFFGLVVKIAPKLLLLDTYSLNFWVHFAWSFILLMVISSLFFIFIEKPCMDKNWHKKLWAKYFPSKADLTN